MPVPTKVPKWSLLVSQPPGLGHVSICDSELVTRGVQPIVCAWGTGPETRGTCLRQQGKIEYICTYIYISSDTFDFEVAESPVLLQSGALCSHHLVFPNGNDCQNDVTGSQAGSRRRGPSRGQGVVVVGVAQDVPWLGLRCVSHEFVSTVQVSEVAPTGAVTGVPRGGSGGEAVTAVRCAAAPRERRLHPARSEQKRTDPHRSSQGGGRAAHARYADLRRGPREAAGFAPRAERAASAVPAP